MSKPDWKDAPEWANWLYLGSIGCWFWAYRKPRWSWFIAGWVMPSESRCEAAIGAWSLEWDWRTRRKSLEERPK